MRAFPFHATLHHFTLQVTCCSSPSASRFSGSAEECWRATPPGLLWFITATLCCCQRLNSLSCFQAPPPENDEPSVSLHPSFLCLQFASGPTVKPQDCYLHLFH